MRKRHAALKKVSGVDVPSCRMHSGSASLGCAEEVAMWHGVEARGCRTTRKRLQHDPDRLGAGLQMLSKESELPLTAADI